MFQRKPQHQHRFDPSGWKEVSRTPNYNVYYLESDSSESKDVIIQEGEDVGFINTCLDCGELLMRYIRT